jgi:hypothetical protein
MKSSPPGRQQELAARGRLVLLLLLVLNLGTPLFAQDRGQENLEAGGLCRFALALPEMEGPLTLGIFSPEGKLIRLLYRDAAIDSIPAGLNGLLIGWDGKDDAGAQVSPGVYHARAMIHGQITCSLLPIHEREWKDSHPQGEEDFSPMPPLIPGNELTVTAAPDALFEQSRPEVRVSARFQGNEIRIMADGLPLFSILCEPWIAGVEKPGLRLQCGTGAGTAILSLITEKEVLSWNLSGLDKIVPLDAGALPMPAAHYLPATACRNSLVAIKSAFP